MDNVKNHRDIKPVINERRINSLLPQPKYPATKKMSEYLLAIEMKKNMYSKVNQSM